MVSLLSVSLFPLTTRNGASRPTKFAAADTRTINPFYSKQSNEYRKVVCACVASPRNLSDESSAIKFNVILLWFLLSNFYFNAILLHENLFALPADVVLVVIYTSTAVYL